MYSMYSLFCDIQIKLPSIFQMLWRLMEANSSCAQLKVRINHEIILVYSLKILTFYAFRVPGNHIWFSHDRPCDSRWMSKTVTHIVRKRKRLGAESDAYISLVDVTAQFERVTLGFRFWFPGLCWVSDFDVQFLLTLSHRSANVLTEFCSFFIQYHRVG